MREGLGRAVGIADRSRIPRSTLKLPGKHMGAIAGGPDPLTSDVARSESWAPAKIS